jgi:polyisoprenyl-phosphate glycosyltransferase
MNDPNPYRSDNTVRPAAEDTLISVILPAYNEARVLPLLIARIAGVLKNRGVDYEILFVNDGSCDETAGILDHLAAANHRVRVVHLSRNFGHQAAVQAGLTHARGHAVVLMDSDMQDAPEAIPGFIAHWRAGYDVVYAIRARRKESAPKRFLFAAFHRLLSSVAAVPIPLDAGNFGLVDRRVARQIAAMGESDRYFPGLRGWVGFRQIGVEVERHARYDRRPRVSLRGLFRLAKTALFSFSALPLMVFYGIGLLATSIFLLLSGFALYYKLLTDLAVPGWTSHLLTGSFFGALNAFGISMLGEYAARIYDQVRHRPLYIVDRTVNIEADGAAADPAETAEPLGCCGSGELRYAAWWHGQETGHNNLETGRNNLETGHNNLETGHNKVESGYNEQESGRNRSADRPYAELMEEAERLLAAAAMPAAHDADPTASEPVIVPFYGELEDAR